MHTIEKPSLQMTLNPSWKGVQVIQKVAELVFEHKPHRWHLRRRSCETPDFVACWALRGST